jgi:hypothetical protein
VTSKVAVCHNLALFPGNQCPERTGPTPRRHFIAKDSAGNTGKVDVGELANPGGVDLSAWKGASSGLLDRTDVDEIAAIQPGSVAAVVVYENRWVLSLVSTWRRDGARFIADGGISASDVVAALDATEPS